MPAVKIHDGSNIGSNKGYAAAVKGPGVAPTTLDEALVVVLSPNSSVTLSATDNITQFGSNPVVTGTGVGGAGIPRVTVSNDSSLAAHQSVNVDQWQGAGTTGGTGPGGPGIPRVTVSNDSVIGGVLLGGVTPGVVPTAIAVTGTTGSTGATGTTGGFMPVEQLDVQTLNAFSGYSLNGSTGVVVDFYTNGAQKVVVHQTVNTGGTQWIAEGSCDGGVTWTVVDGQFIDAIPAAVANSNSGVNNARLLEFPVPTPRMRLRVTVSGTTLTVVPVLRNAAFAWAIQGLTQLTSASVSAGTTLTRVTSAAGVNNTNVKASAGNLYGFILSNTTGGPTGSTGATGLFIKFYNKATAPTAGTDTPLWTTLLPAGATVIYRPDFPDRFSTGIAYAITSNNQDNDTVGCSVAGLVHGQLITV